MVDARSDAWVSPVGSSSDCFCAFEGGGRVNRRFESGGDSHARAELDACLARSARRAELPKEFRHGQAPRPEWGQRAHDGANFERRPPAVGWTTQAKISKKHLQELRPAPTVDTRPPFSMAELVATVSGADVKVWRPDSQVRAAGDSSDSLRSRAQISKRAQNSQSCPLLYQPPQRAECTASTALRCEAIALQWSPTNGALACGGFDGRAHLLKPSGELLGVIPQAPEDVAEANGAINALAFSKGSRYLATGGADAEVVIWDLKRKSKLKTLSGHVDEVNAVVYSPGDQHVASGGASGAVLLHSPVSGLAVGEMRVVSDVPDADGGITSLHYSPHRRQMLASSSMDGRVQLWDTGIRRLGRNLQAAAGASPCWQASFSPTASGLVAAACGDGRVTLLDVNAPGASKGVGSIALGAEARCLSWRSDGGVVAAGAADGRVVWIDPRMLSSSLGAGYGGSGSAVLYTTAAHVGAARRGGVRAVRWQHAADGGAAAQSAAAGEATTPTPMRATRPAPFASTPASSGGRDLASPAPAMAPPTGKENAVDPGRMEAMKEDSRRRVERLMSARAAGGTPESVAAAARPSLRDDVAASPLALTPSQAKISGGSAHHEPLGSMASLREMLRVMAAEQLEEQRRMIHAEVRNVHVELIRQFHTLQEEQIAMFEELRGAQRELAKEVAALKKSQGEFVMR